MVDVLAVMREEGITLDDLSVASGFSAYSCRKYVYGEREIRSKAERELVARHGSRANAIIRAMHEKRAEWIRSHPVAPCGKKRLALKSVVEKRQPVLQESWKPMPRAADEDWDGELYTIEEWRRLFGAPGSSQGANGRVEGFFQTEPCFLGE
jgi:hypothetical protein